MSDPTLAQVALPVPVDGAEVSEAPFSYNGRVVILGNGFGSAALVEDGVITTAAHVVFDEDPDVLNWVPNSNVRYYPRYHGESSGPNFIPAAFHRWTSYYPDRVAEDDEPGFSSPDTFNVDFAAGFFSSLYSDPLLADFPEVHVDTVGEVGILRDTREMTLIGYPSQEPEIPETDVGLMHATAPGFYPGFWEGIEGLSEMDFAYPGGLWYGLYQMEEVATYRGGSGGALYARDDSDNWLMTGVLVGGSGSGTALVRGIDDNAYAFIKTAIRDRGVSGMKRVEDLEVSDVSGSSVTLQWTDNSDNEANYQIFRQVSGIFEKIAILDPDTESYTDEVSPLAGHVAHYKVQAVSETGMVAPKSVAESAQIPGRHADSAIVQSTVPLQISTTGQSSWYLDDLNRLHSGKTRSNGSSSLLLDIIGPGTLDFGWSVSSEINPDYNNPLSPYVGQIYDALHLALDGDPVMEEGEPVFLSGDVSATPYQLQIPSGAHRVEWRYEKDPYSSELEDAGFIHNLDWTPDTENFYPVFGSYELEDPAWHGSSWFGDYHAALSPWAYHRELGWIYILGGSAEGDLYGYIDSPELGTFYTTPEIFPFIYFVYLKTWAYYFPGSGDFGSGAIIWKAKSNYHVVLP